jgi:Mrp family chromosome partitioning ATPase
MAKLDQSFIKAYGHAGLRGGGAQPVATNAAPSQAVAPQVAAPKAASSAAPVVSATPIVVDTGAFAFDTTSTIAHDTPASSAPRPHIKPVLAVAPLPVAEEPVAAPRKTRRPPAKKSTAVPPVASPSNVAANLATTFQADSFTVDTAAAAEMKPPIAKPSAPTKPVETKRAAPRMAADHFCHRACTVEFSTVDETAAEPAQDECLELEIDDEAPHDETQYAELATAPALQQAQNAVTAPRIDGVAYHRMAATPSATLRTGYEVDAFRWPEVVDGLSGRATTALSTLIDELVDASSIGRGVVMFAGERRGAGTTTLAAYAARRLAQLGLSVALVDADFGKPALARTLGVAAEFGWDDSLEAQHDSATAMIASLGDSVTILPLRHAVSVDAVKAARISADLAVLRKHFALVILDGGPLAEVAEPWIAHAPEDTIDCAIVVRDVRVDSGRSATRRPHAQRSAAVPAIGVVENFVHESAASK